MGTATGDIMMTEFPFVDCDVTIAEAEEYFEEIGLSALPVLNPDRTVFGLLLPKHFASFYRRPLNNPRAFHAWEICDARPLLAAPGDDMDDVAAALLDSGSRHVLIINEERQMVGVVTMELLLEHELSHGRRAQYPHPESTRKPLR